MRRKIVPEAQFVPKRVLMTADTLGGIWTFALELARALANYGVEIELATMGKPLTRDQTREVLGLRNVELHASGFKLEWMPDPWEDVLRAGDWLLELERQTSPDIIHLNGYAHGALRWLAPVVVVGHSCVYSWWRAVHGGDPPPEWKRYREAVTSGLRAASLVLAPSRTMLEILEELYGPFRESDVIFNGRQLPGLKWHTKEEFILTAGRLWDQAKNLPALGAIAGRIRWPIYVAGEGRHPCGGMASFEGLKCLGSLPAEDLAAWYARAAIYALPARYEPFGLSALEAGLADCALVLGDIPSLREIWGRAAVFVPPDDSEALRRAIVGLMTDWRRLIGMGVRARYRAQELTPLRMGSQYLAAYSRVLEHARAAVKEKQELPLCAS